MAELKINDLFSTLILILLGLPGIFSVNIDCAGNAFHCVDSTHFMICVDLGGGDSSTVDDFVIPCPPSTYCNESNTFECEFHHEVLESTTLGHQVSTKVPNIDAFLSSLSVTSGEHSEKYLNGANVETDTTTNSLYFNNYKTMERNNDNELTEIHPTHTVIFTEPNVNENNNNTKIFSKATSIIIGAPESSVTEGVTFTTTETNAYTGRVLQDLSSDPIKHNTILFTSTSTSKPKNIEPETQNTANLSDVSSTIVYIKEPITNNDVDIKHDRINAINNSVFGKELSYLKNVSFNYSQDSFAGANRSKINYNTETENYEILSTTANINSINFDKLLNTTRPSIDSEVNTDSTSLKQKSTVTSISENHNNSIQTDFKSSSIGTTESIFYSGKENSENQFMPTLFKTVVTVSNVGKNFSTSVPFLLKTTTESDIDSEIYTDNTSLRQESTVTSFSENRDGSTLTEDTSTIKSNTESIFYTAKENPENQITPTLFETLSFGRESSNTTDYISTVIPILMNSNTKSPMGSEFDTDNTSLRSESPVISFSENQNDSTLIQVTPTAKSNTELIFNTARNNSENQLSSTLFESSTVSVGSENLSSEQPVISFIEIQDDSTMTEVPSTVKSKPELIFNTAKDNPENQMSTILFESSTTVSVDTESYNTAEYINNTFIPILLNSSTNSTMSSEFDTDDTSLTPKPPVITFSENQDSYFLAEVASTVKSDTELIFNTATDNSENQLSSTLFQSSTTVNVGSENSNSEPPVVSFSEIQDHSTWTDVTTTVKSNIELIFNTAKYNSENQLSSTLFESSTTVNVSRENSNSEPPVISFSENQDDSTWTDVTTTVKSNIELIFNTAKDNSENQLSSNLFESSTTERFSGESSNTAEYITSTFIPILMNSTINSPMPMSSEFDTNNTILILEPPDITFSENKDSSDLAEVSSIVQSNIELIFNTTKDNLENQLSSTLFQSVTTVSVGSENSNSEPSVMSFSENQDDSTMTEHTPIGKSNTELIFNTKKENSENQLSSTIFETSNTVSFGGESSDTVAYITSTIPTLLDNLTEKVAETKFTEKTEAQATSTVTEITTMTKKSTIINHHLPLFSEKDDTAKQFTPIPLKAITVVNISDIISNKTGYTTTPNLINITDLTSKNDNSIISIYNKYPATHGESNTEMSNTYTSMSESNKLTVVSSNNAYNNTTITEEKSEIKYNTKTDHSGTQFSTTLNTIINFNEINSNAAQSKESSIIGNEMSTNDNTQISSVINIYESPVDSLNENQNSTTINDVMFSVKHKTEAGFSSEIDNLGIQYTATLFDAMTTVHNSDLNSNTAEYTSTISRPILDSVNETNGYIENKSTYDSNNIISGNSSPAIVFSDATNIDFDDAGDGFRVKGDIKAVSDMKIKKNGNEFISTTEINGIDVNSNNMQFTTNSSNNDVKMNFANNLANISPNVNISTQSIGSNIQDISSYNFFLTNTGDAGNHSETAVRKNFSNETDKNNIINYTSNTEIEPVKIGSNMSDVLKLLTNNTSKSFSTTIYEKSSETSTFDDSFSSKSTQGPDAIIESISGIKGPIERLESNNVVINKLGTSSMYELATRIINNDTRNHSSPRLNINVNVSISNEIFTTESGIEVDKSDSVNISTTTVANDVSHPSIYVYPKSENAVDLLTSTSNDTNIIIANTVVIPQKTFKEENIVDENIPYNKHTIILDSVPVFQLNYNRMATKTIIEENDKVGDKKQKSVATDPTAQYTSVTKRRDLVMTKELGIDILDKINTTLISRNRSSATAVSRVEEIKDSNEQESSSESESSTSEDSSLYINFNPNKINLKPRQNRYNLNDSIDCKHRKRGKYSNEQNCHTYYVCIGKRESLVSECLEDTVFSDILKQCTNNLSHCVRNGNFVCPTEGRFGDIHHDNLYYICVEKEDNKFIRFKMQCQKNYHLDKRSVRCILSSESNNIELENNYYNDSKSNDNDNNDRYRFKCENEGMFADPNDCKVYYKCSVRKTEFRRKRKTCDSDKVFNEKKQQCVSSESYECN